MIVGDFFRVKLHAMRREIRNATDIMCVIIKSTCQNKGQVEAGLNHAVVCRVSAIKKKFIRDAFLRVVVISGQFIVVINVFRFLPNVGLECN